jgi:peptidoglycan/LPS O-acetylase OafA/YrhL
MTRTAPEGVGSLISIAPEDGHGHYKPLDGLRGVAILLVFVFHVNGIADHLRASWFGVVLLLGASWGWMGVDLFFVLSGFLITGILIRSLNGPRYFRNFYIRRALRIFPLFYGVLLLLVVLTPFLHLEWRLGHISYLFYCQNIAMEFSPDLRVLPPAIHLEHFWSLAVEEQYYMIWPMIVWLVRKESRIMKLCFAMIACGILLRILAIGLLPLNSALDLTYLELPTHWDGLLIGSWLALAVRRWPIEQLSRNTRWLVWLAFVLLLGVAGTTQTLDLHTTAMELAGLTLIPIVFGGLLLRCLVPGSPAARFFSLRPLRFLGRYSYGIYVYHFLFYPLLLDGFRWLQAHLHSRVVAASVFVLLWAAGSVAVSVLSFKYFEAPFLRLKARFAPPGKMPPAAYAPFLDAVQP